MASAEDLCYLPAVELAAAIRERRVSPVEVVDAVLDRIDRLNPAVNAFITVIPEEARAAAAAAEREVMSQPVESLGRLHGVPITVKDLTPTAGVRTTFAVKEEIENVPDSDGLTWSRLKAEGPILIGKTATPPLGALCVTQSEVHGVTNNPWDLTRTAGGSSGGAGAALASGFGPLAVGSDGGGSIRNPSSYCGVVGLKPSRGRIPIYTEGYRFETVSVVGPMARTVDDVALMLSIMAGPHPRDPYSLLDGGHDFLAPLGDVSLSGQRIAFCPDLGRGPIESDVLTAVQAAATVFESTLGAAVDFVEMDMPAFTEYFRNHWVPYFAAFMGESSPYDFSAYPPLTRWIREGAEVSVSDHLHTVLGVRELVHEAFSLVFDDHDLVVSATAPQVAFPHPEREHMGPTVTAGQVVGEPAVDFHRLTDPPAEAGFPAISVPCGFNADGLPVGIQIVGRHGADAEVLAAAAAFQRATAFLDCRPGFA